MSDKSVWLIERKYNSEARYFSGYVEPFEPNQMGAFRPEPETAIQFARKEDAAIFLKQFLSGNGCVHEHIWMEPKP